MSGDELKGGTVSYFGPVLGQITPPDPADKIPGYTIPIHLTMPPVHYIFVYTEQEAYRWRRFYRDIPNASVYIGKVGSMNYLPATKFVSAIVVADWRLRCASFTERDEFEEWMEALRTRCSGPILVI